MRTRCSLLVRLQAHAASAGARTCPQLRASHVRVSTLLQVLLRSALARYKDSTIAAQRLVRDGGEGGEGAGAAAGNDAAVGQTPAEQAPAASATASPAKQAVSVVAKVGMQVWLRLQARCTRHCRLTPEAHAYLRRRCAGAGQRGAELAEESHGGVSAGVQ